MTPEYILATDFDRARYNFELTLPLNPIVAGKPNPFYVERPGDPTQRLVEALLGLYYQPPKYFFSGHTGSGKSTELRRLAAHPDIQAKYYPIHFTIYEEADVNNLDFKDILLGIGGRMYRDYKAAGGKLPSGLENELETWRGNVVTEIEDIDKTVSAELKGELGVFFAKVSSTFKMEPQRRQTVRQVFARNVTGLIQVIDTIADGIRRNENEKIPLVLIDDLDKPDLATAKELFVDRLVQLRLPKCAIVYTINLALYYTLDIRELTDSKYFLPNIKLYEHHTRRKNRKGYELMREYVLRRVEGDLIAPRALEEAIRLSGGVFREMARVMRSCFELARRTEQVTVAQVRQVENEIENEFRGLNFEQRRILKQIYATHQFDHPEQVAPLLKSLAVLEYANDKNWWDVHPALIRPLKESENDE